MGGGEGEREGLGSILTKGKYPHEGEVSSRRGSILTKVRYAAEAICRLHLIDTIQSRLTYWPPKDCIKTARNINGISF